MSDELDGLVEKMAKANWEAYRAEANERGSSVGPWETRYTDDRAYDVRRARRYLSALSPTTLAALPGLEAGTGGWLPTHRHYKGGFYRVVCVARQEADLRPVVVYECAVVGPCGPFWTRPLDEFQAELPGIGRRFEPLDGFVMPTLPQPPPANERT